MIRKRDKESLRRNKLSKLKKIKLRLKLKGNWKKKNR